MGSYAWQWAFILQAVVNNKAWKQTQACHRCFFLCDSAYQLFFVAWAAQLLNWFCCCHRYYLALCYLSHQTYKIVLVAWGFICCLCCLLAFRQRLASIDINLRRMVATPYYHWRVLYFHRNGIFFTALTKTVTIQSLVCDGLVFILNSLGFVFLYASSPGNVFFSKQFRAL
jgi:hypothetical protein